MFGCKMDIGGLGGLCVQVLTVFDKQVLSVTVFYPQNVLKTRSAVKLNVFSFYK